MFYFDKFYIKKLFFQEESDQIGGIALENHSAKSSKGSKTTSGFHL